MRGLRARGFAAVLARGLALLALGAGEAAAQRASLDVLFDLDRNPTTGCDVATVEGVAAGVELRLRTEVDLATGVVDAIARAACVDDLLDSFGAGVPVATAPLPGWSVAAGHGIEGSTLVESHVPRVALGGVRRARVFVVVDVAGAGDALLAGEGGGGLEVTLAVPVVPALGGLGVAALLLLAGGVGAKRLGVRRSPRAAFVSAGVACLAACLAVSLAGVEVAQALLGEGVHRAWVPAEHVAYDAAADAPEGADLLGFSAAVDGASDELWLRLDVAFGPPVCLDWGLVSAGTGYACGAWPPLDPSPFAGPVALTFDDGPSPATTPAVLATLRAHGIPATFFLLGDRLTTPAEQALALEIHQDPLFRVATHSVDHADLTELPPGDVAYQIDEGLARVRAAVGDPCWFPTFFRFPYAHSDCASMEILRQRGQAVAGVNMDTVDWCYAAGGGTCSPTIVPDIEPEVVDDLPGKALIEYQQHGGGIMLMHDIHPTTVAALPHVITTLQAAGATFVDLADTAHFPNLNAEILAPEAPACCVSVGP